MKMKMIPALLALMLLSSILSGCKDGSAKLKTDAQQAISNQPQMKNYSFTGHADLNLGVSMSANSTNPLVMALLSSLKQSHIDWNGVVDTEPLRMEATITITPTGSATAFDLPLIIKDNKLYLSIPLISQKGQYFEIDLQQKTIDQLKNTLQLSTDISTLLFNGVSSKWYKKDKQDAKLADGTKAKVISIDINDSNQQEITTSLEQVIPQMIELLQKDSVITSEQTDKWKQNDKNSIQLNAPGKLSLSIDDKGFIREQHVILHFTAKHKDDAATSNNQVEWQQSYNDINQNPKFTQDVPTDVKPLDDILKMLQAN